MTWFRCGGGSGIPASLKNAMNAVFNKKFGTSIDYPADGWPDDVDLLGLLEEKTASGSIVTFSDGADDVPLKSCEVALPASLDGYSSVDAVQSGKNLFNKNGKDTANGYVAGYWLRNTGTESSNADYYISEYIAVKSGATITLQGLYGNAISFCEYDEQKSYITGTRYENNSTLTVTLNANTQYIRITVYSANENITMVEYGSTATAYTPYTAPTTHTASLGRTIYGGTPDVVNGEGEETHYSFVGTDLQTIGISSTTSDVIVFQAYFSINGLPNGVNGSIISNIFDTAIPSGQAHRMVLSSNILYFVIAKSELVSEDVAGCKQWFIDNPTSFVYELSTPTDFTFEPVEINSKLGDNTMWSDGDMSVVYRASGTMTPIQPTLISKTIAANGTYTASDDDVDGYSEVVVNVTAAVDPIMSANAFVTKSGVSGTDASTVARSFTMSSAGKLIFAPGTYGFTNTGSNDGYFEIQKNGVSVVKQYCNTSTNTPITVPEISVEENDVVDLVVGFDNAHSNCNFQFYSAMVVVSEV